MSLELDTVFRARAQSRSLVFTALRVFVAGVRNYMQRRAAQRALSRLTPDELKDIGLVRTEFGYRELRQDRLGADYWSH